MMAEKKAKSSSHGRMVTCYPSPKYHTLLLGYQKHNELKKSEAMARILQEYFDKMPEPQKAVCLNEGIIVTRSKHQY